MNCFGGDWEHVSTSLWIKQVKEANIVFDIGANTGIYSLIAKNIKPETKVYAFEPVERVFQKLKFNNQLNNFGILCYDQALSNTDGDAIIYDMPTEHIYSVTINKNSNSPDVAVIPTNIKVCWLDTFMEQNKIERIDLLKIDVETHEAEVYGRNGAIS